MENPKDPKRRVNRGRPLLSEEAQLPVFVYGTLRPGQKNYPHFLRGKTFRETTATVGGRLFFVRKGGYPYVLPGAGTVTGELLDLRPEIYQTTLSRLDDLEEYDPRDEANSIYLRRRCIVTVVGGHRRMAWIYFWNGLETAGERIESGDFRDRPTGDRSK